MKSNFQTIKEGRGGNFYNQETQNFFCFFLSFRGWGFIKGGRGAARRTNVAGRYAAFLSNRKKRVFGFFKEGKRGARAQTKEKKKSTFLGICLLARPVGVWGPKAG